MKKTLLLTLTLAAASVCAAADITDPDWQYVDARELRIINKGFDDTARDYWRIPAYLQDSVRSTLWERQQCSAGIGVRFATDSRRIGVKYQLLLNTHMIHMADTGLKGTDLYILEGDSVWRHVNTNRPYVKDDSTRMVESTYVQRLDGGMHEYMVYMPLYDGVERLWIKVDSGAVITPGRPDIIDRDRRIVAYGTSIMQGGCASRSGMASTNIIGRELNAEVINLGFSGDGKMDNCMARAMATIDDVDLYILDPVPNCTEMMCDTLTYDFVRILADARPHTPILMVAGPIYPYARYDSHFGEYLPAKNAAFRRNYDRLVADGYTNIYYIDSDGMDGVEDDGTVDGIHLTDLGFRHYADHLLPEIRRILGW
ncbi:MAG: SGNH/GDSL hydrolase family protein [Bacteroidales bacterium]|nr:SGNH/GDSL hydrolase family protein [Bacteroidales bacterium]